MNVIVTYLFTKLNQPREVKWFTNALYVFLLCKILIYTSQLNELFSESALIFNRPYVSNSIKDVAFVLTNNYSYPLAIVFLFSITTACVLLLIGKSNYIIKFLLWLLVLNLHNYLYPIITAGEFLVNQLLFFNIFLTSNSSTNVNSNNFKIGLHNTALIALKTQVCLAYFIAALFKLQCAEWLNGQALQQITAIHMFSNYFLASTSNFILMCATYLVLGYQLMFPVIVFNNNLKKYVLGFGILQHLFIAFVMGLTSFGFVMIICYILFLKYNYK